MESVLHWPPLAEYRHTNSLNTNGMQVPKFVDHDSMTGLQVNHEHLVPGSSEEMCSS